MTIIGTIRSSTMRIGYGHPASEILIFISLCVILCIIVWNDGKLINFSQVWIGATDLKDSGEFEYYDGEPIKFSIPWAKNQHDNKKTKKQGSKILFYVVKIYSITHLELNYAILNSSLTDMNI